jgi:hypothetical protein
VEAAGGGNVAHERVGQEDFLVVLQVLPHEEPGESDLV